MLTLTFNNSDFFVDDKNQVLNTMCYVNERLADNIQIEVLVIILDQGGFGDIVFGIKFVTYILNAFSNVRVTVLCEKNFQEFIQDDIIPKFGDRALVSPLENTEPKYFQPTRQYSVLYIAPDVRDTNIILTGPYAESNYQQLQNNSYAFTEYNVNGGGIMTGIPSTDISETSKRGQVGLMLNTYDEFYPLPPLVEAQLNGRMFSICYIYTSEDMLKQMVPKSDDVMEDEYPANTMVSLLLCFASYLQDLEGLSKKYGEDIVVLMKHNVVDDFLNFASFYRATLDAHGIGYIVNILEQMRTGVPGVELIDYCPVSKREMLSLYQQCLPVVFISGDQSITDFISVNKYFTSHIYYQIFIWKESFANALGISQSETCGTISQEMLEQIHNDLDYDFRLNGLKIIESTLIFSVKGRPPGGCNSYVQGEDEDQLNTKAYSELVLSLLYREEELIYEIRQEGVNTILLYQDPAKLKIFMSHIPRLSSSNDYLVANWIDGSVAGNIFGKLVKMLQPPSDAKCSSLYLTYYYDIAKKANIVPEAVVMVLMAKLCNDDIRANQFSQNLTYTYAALDTTSCSIDLPPGMLFLSEMPSTSMQLDRFISSQYWTLENIASVTFQLLWTIQYMQSPPHFVLMNNLNMPNSIFVELLPNKKEVLYPLKTGGSVTLLTRMIVHVQDFSKSTITIDGSTYASSQAPVVVFDAESDKNMFCRSYRYMNNKSGIPLDDLVIMFVSLYQLVRMKPKLSEYPASDLDIILADPDDLTGNLQHIKSF